MPILVNGLVAVIALICATLVPIVHHAWQRHERAIDQHSLAPATAAAAKVVLPATFVPTSHLGGLPCVDAAAGQGDLACWLNPSGPPGDDLSGRPSGQVSRGH
ncbi:MAG TPA: hypothetical protein VHV79_06300 [Mycobacteriales bacterium]|nr:hypothetical protein [Mycobacteriales bacterium]